MNQPGRRTSADPPSRLKRLNCQLAQSNALIFAGPSPGIEFGASSSSASGGSDQVGRGARIGARGQCAAV